MEFAKNPFPFGKYAEEVLNEKELSEHYQREAYMAERHPELEKWLQEADKGGYLDAFAAQHGMTREELLSRGAATVVALIQTTVIDNTFPLLVGRQVSTIVPIEVGTAGTSVTFYLRKPAVAHQGAGAGTTLRVGARYDTKQISVNEIIEETMEWDRTFVEDVPFAVALDGSKEVARAVAVRETSKILTAIDSGAASTGADFVTTANSPGGNQHTAASTTPATGAAPETITTGPWFDLSNAVAVIEGDDGMADFALFHASKLLKLWTSSFFVHQFIFGDSFDVKTGVLGESYLGFRIVKSSLVPTAGDVNLGNSYYVKVPIKRELLTEPYENPAMSLFGYKASERLGADIVPRYPVATKTTRGLFDFFQITSF